MTMPWPMKAASPWMLIGRAVKPAPAPRPSVMARVRPATTGATNSRWLGLKQRLSATLLPFGEVTALV